MAHKVVMPQLGMAQDSAIILSWSKAPGDAVKIGDILMEVETDKTTVEVEAAHDGFVTDIRAPAGSDVLVGEVIAVISDNSEDIDFAKTEPRAEPVTDKAPALPHAAQAASSTPPPPVVSPVSEAPGTHIILASPKAKVEAKRRNIDIAALVNSGVQQPIHFSDVADAVTDTETRLSPQAQTATANGVVSLKVARRPVEKFLNWLATERPGDVRQDVVWMSFVTRAWRNSCCADLNDDVQCQFWAPMAGGEPPTAINVDKTTLSSVQLISTDTVSQIAIYDLQNTPISRFSPSISPEQISIVITSSRKKLHIECQYREAALASYQAVRFASEFAKLLAQPIQILV